MDIHDFIKLFKRYCRAHACISCPVNDACPRMPSDHVIREVIRWGDEHPKPTNAETIRKLFGVHVFPSTDHPGYFCIQGAPGNAEVWLDSEYKGD